MPAVASVAASGTGITNSNGDVSTGSVVTLTLSMTEAVTVAGGTPTLTLNDGGTATYTGGSGGTALTFSYTVAAGQNTSDLSVSAVNLNGATIKDGAGNNANLSGTFSPAGTLQIDTTAPTVASVAAVGNRHHQRQRRSQGRQRGHADAHHERGGDGGGRHADAHAQRWRHGDLHRRLGRHRADLQLYGGRRAEHRRPVGRARSTSTAPPSRMGLGTPPTSPGPSLQPARCRSTPRRPRWRRWRPLGPASPTATAISRPAAWSR